MSRLPDKDHDVIVHQRGARGRDTWTVWIGDEQQGERDSLRAATELACHLATLHNRSAWLDGSPLTPIERGRYAESDRATGRPRPIRLVWSSDARVQPVLVRGRPSFLTGLRPADRHKVTVRALSHRLLTGLRPADRHKVTVRALSDRLAPDPGMAVGHWLAGLDAADEQGHVTFNERGRVLRFPGGSRTGLDRRRTPGRAGRLLVHPAAPHDEPP